jgi:hypothetical protein
VVECWDTGWMIGGSSPGRGGEFFSSPPRPDRLWGPPSLLSNGYYGLFTEGGGVKWPVREADHSPPSSASVCVCVCVCQECVELYLYSLKTPSWHGAQLQHRGNVLLSLSPQILTCSNISYCSLYKAPTSSSPTHNPSLTLLCSFLHHTFHIIFSSW